MSKEIKWDYDLSTPIDYFDAEKSYELTGYRPINKTQGLDFDPNWFREAAITKINTGKYCPHFVKSPRYIDYWKEQKKRCIEGYTVNGYRITGDNYFFLNFYNLKTSDEDTITQQFGFPNFLVFQYEYFHYIEMCMLLKKDAAVLKARALKTWRSL